MTEAPLAGLLVADFSRVLAGPLVASTLADLGARVIKVERPGAGDDTRGWAPPVSPTGSTYFDSVNRGKESVTLDLSSEPDRALAARLAERADVLVENFRPGTAGRLGLDETAIRTVNPGLVWCSVSGYGTAGGADLAGYDFVVQAASGLMHITGESDGPPTKAGVALVDVLTAKDALVGILAALHRRDRTGEGGRVDVALLTSIQAALVNQVQSVLGPIGGDGGREPGRAGSVHPSIAPYQLLECRDRPIAIAVGNDAQFAKVAALLGEPALATDDRFVTNAQRVAHREQLVERLEALLATDDAEAWERALHGVGVAASTVRTVGEGLQLADDLGLDPVREVRGAAGSGRTVASPVRIDGDARTHAAAPPLLGEHDRDVRAWLESA